MTRIALLPCFALVLAASPARAAFHLMWINEVMSQAEGDPRIQFIELRMREAGQNFVSGHKLLFFDGEGNARGEYAMPGNVAGGAKDSTILIATQAFADSADIAPDFILPDGLLPPFSGRVCFADIDCVAYGKFSGDNGRYGNPAPGFPVLGTVSLTRGRTATPPDNSTDYALAAPSPRSNGGADGTLDVAPPAVYLDDSFENLDNWDVLAPGAGIDLNSCGIPAVVDLGSMDVENSKLLMFPGAEDALGLGNPIIFTGLSSEAANRVIEQTGPDETYRLKYNVRAQFGIVQAFSFVRQHYFFTEDNALDVLPASGTGLNYTFGCGLERAPEECPDNASDHAHPDNRTICIQEFSEPDKGPRNARFSAMERMVPEVEYTVIMDVDGDDVDGPLAMQAKFYPADTDEPAEYTESWLTTIGLDASPDEEFDHLILIGGFRSSGVEAGPALEISELSISAIPRNQKHVRFVECTRDQDGNVEVTWNNPFDAELDQPIRVYVNGALADTLDGDATDYFVAGDLEGDVTVEVVNYSGVGVSCTACRNAPPEVVIDAPAVVSLGEAMAGITIDSSASNDGNGSTEGLSRIWQITDAPGGANMTLSSDLATVVTFTTDLEGEYALLLTITDEGCPGDFAPLSAEKEVVITVSSEGPPPAELIRGDCNGDGGTNVADAVFHLNSLFGGSELPPCEEACNVNDDASNNISDPVALLNFLFGGGAHPPAPGPEACGPDPDPDSSLGCDTPSC